MPKQKGRGGKKQRYSIADIGGGDLTSQDLSTEKVLNFLIRGGISETEERDETLPIGGISSRAESAPIEEASLPSQDDSGTSQEIGSQPHRRSLDHLFNRVNKGVVKESAPVSEVLLKAEGEVTEAKVTISAPPQEAAPLPINLLSDKDLAIEPTAPPSVALLEAASPQAPSGSTALPDPAPLNSLLRETEVPSPPTVIGEQSPPAVAEDYELELSHQVERWKGFYRLKDGEISALSTLFRLSHALGSPECYVKMHKLAETRNLTYRYCQKVVRSLEQLGWIVRLKEYDPSTQMGVLYRINLKPTE